MSPMKREEIHTRYETTCTQNCSSQLFHIPPTALPPWKNKHNHPRGEQEATFGLKCSHHHKGITQVSNNTKPRTKYIAFQTVHVCIWRCYKSRVLSPFITVYNISVTGTSLSDIIGGRKPDCQIE